MIGLKLTSVGLHISPDMITGVTVILIAGSVFLVREFLIDVYMVFAIDSTW